MPKSAVGVSAWWRIFAILFPVSELCIYGENSGKQRHSPIIILSYEFSDFYSLCSVSVERAHSESVVQNAQDTIQRERDIVECSASRAIENQRILLALIVTHKGHFSI